MVTKIFKFLAGNSLNQLIQLITGFLLIRWLPVEEYAYYTFLLAIQTTALMFTEMGFGSAIIPLVSEDTKNKERIKKLISAAVKLRHYTFFIVSIVSSTCFLSITYNRGWPNETAILLMGSMLYTLWFNTNITIYSTPLLIERKVSKIYKSNILCSSLRLISLVTAFFTGILHSTTTAWISAVSTSINGFIIKRNSIDLISKEKLDIKKEKREVINYIAPLLPGMIFASVQGQLLIFLASFFGNTQLIASVGAISRISLLFTVLASLNAQLIGPYIAKLQEKQYRKQYILVILTGIAVSSLIFILGYILRNQLLWLLGSNYKTLENELVLVLLNSCLAYLSGLFWTVHAARRWIFWWMPVFSISGTLIVQITYLFYIPINDLSSLLLLGTTTEIYNLLMRITVACYGFKAKPRIKIT